MNGHKRIECGILAFKQEGKSKSNARILCSGAARQRDGKKSRGPRIHSLTPRVVPAVTA